METVLLGDAWSRKPTLLNGWISIPSAVVAETMARHHWGTLTVDMQHGLIDFQSAISMLQAISASSLPAIVRVPWLEPGILMRVLDAG